MKFRMYEATYDSMLIWYKKWYPQQHQRYLMTSFAMSMFLFFNFLTVAALMELLGVSIFDSVLLSTRVIPIGLFVVLLLFNLAFGKTRLSKSARSSSGVTDDDRQRKHALIYMLGSFFGFVMTMIWSFAHHN